MLIPVQLSRRASKEFSKLPSSERVRVRAALNGLDSDAPTLDVKPIVGHAPWLRLRVGDLRVVYRPVGNDVWLVDRIIHRRDLERVADSL